MYVQEAALGQQHDGRCRRGIFFDCGTPIKLKSQSSPRKDDNNSWERLNVGLV